MRRCPGRDRTRSGSKAERAPCRALTQRPRGVRSRSSPASGLTCRSQSSHEGGGLGLRRTRARLLGRPLRGRQGARGAGLLRRLRERLERHGLGCRALGAHLVGQAVCDPIDARHRAILPPEVWGDGEPAGVRARAAERMKDTARAAARFGVPRSTASPVRRSGTCCTRSRPTTRRRSNAATSSSPRLGADPRRLRRRGRSLRARGAPDRDRLRLRDHAKTLAAIDRRSAFGINLDPPTSPTSSSTRPRSRSSSQTASTTCTSRTPSGAWTGVARSSART